MKVRRGVEGEVLTGEGETEWVVDAGEGAKADGAGGSVDAGGVVWSGGEGYGVGSTDEEQEEEGQGKEHGVNHCNSFH